MRAVFDQERVIMARVRYIKKFMSNYIISEPLNFRSIFVKKRKRQKKNINCQNLDAEKNECYFRKSFTLFHLEFEKSLATE